jgi:hypothetical protein
VSEERVQRILPVALAVVIALAAIAPLRSYDLFWHLATGRWIVEHRALPLHDPFALASDRVEWINGEWLFQIFAYGIESSGGIKALALSRAMFVAMVLLGGYLVARRENADDSATLVLTALAFTGAMRAYDMRPTLAAALLVVIATRLRSPLAFAILSIVWINTHPSGLLVPLIAFLVTRSIAAPLAAAAGLLVNPFGWKAIAAPLSLLSFVGGGSFVNSEWLPSAPALFPVLYVCIAIALAAFVTSRTHWWRAALLAVFAYLAIRHVRDQGLFYAAFVPLVAPAIPTRVVIRRSVALVLSMILIAWTAISRSHRPELAPNRFPTAAVARLRQTGFAGNIYNPDQFGGFLIWSFYPQRRVLNDGRNELYRSFIPEYAKARIDSRAWTALLARYKIDLAVDEYRAPLHVTSAKSGQRMDMPASLAYWPRREWALIAYDGAAMVFARRAAFSESDVARWEIRDVVPDAR